MVHKYLKHWTVKCDTIKFFEPTTRRKRAVATTFPRDGALELGRVSLCDQDVPHGSNEDRSRDPSHSFDHLRDWKEENKTKSMISDRVSNQLA